MHTAPGCSGPLFTSILKAYGRLRHESASSGCRSGAAGHHRRYERVDELHRLRRAGRPCRTLPGAGACFSMRSSPVCVPDTARFAVPVDIPSPSSTSLVPARGGSAETQRPWRRRGKSLAYRLSSCKRSLAGGALNSPYFLIPWPTHLCSAGPMSWLSCSSLLCAQVATRTLRAARTRACDGTEAAW